MPPPTAATSTSARAAIISTTRQRLQQAGAGHGLRGAIGGVTRIHAILGASERCIATHPSDMCVALAALDARVRVTGPSGERVIPFARLPPPAGRRSVSRDNTLATGELVTAIDLPAEEFACQLHLSQAARPPLVRLRPRLGRRGRCGSSADGHIEEARIALGGVAHKPWRLPEVGSSGLRRPGRRRQGRRFARSPRRCSRQAPSAAGGNDFKIELAQRAIVRALKQAADGTPQSQTDKRVA